MFDPLLELRRRRMQQTGLPEVAGNVLPPEPVAGPDIIPPPVVMAPPMQMQAPVQSDGPDFGGLSELAARRGMNFLMKKMKPEQGVDLKAMEGVPVLSKLFRR